MQRFITRTSPVLLGILLAAPLLAGAAWTTAPASPPSNNVEAPINVSNNAQTKTGNLTVSGLASDSLLVQSGGSAYISGGTLGVGVAPSATYKLDAAGKVNALQYCIAGANCISAWPTGGAGLSGSGTTNYISKWTGATSLGNSMLYDSGTRLGVGNAAPGYKLDVSGDIGGTAFYYTSDQRLKNNIVALSETDSLNKILKLQGVSFTWKSDGAASVGLIAQDVEKVYPELVGTNSATSYKSVEYANLVAPLIEAVKAQQKQIDALKAEVAALKK